MVGNIITIWEESTPLAATMRVAGPDQDSRFLLTPPGTLELVIPTGWPAGSWANKKDGGPKPTAPLLRTNGRKPLESADAEEASTPRQSTAVLPSCQRSATPAGRKQPTQPAGEEHDGARRTFRSFEGASENRKPEHENLARQNLPLSR
jgi:hypothetical protein